MYVVLTEFSHKLYDDAVPGDGPAHLERQLIVQHLTVQLRLQTNIQV